MDPYDEEEQDREERISIRKQEETMTDILLSGTTATLIIQTGKKIYIGWVGDSLVAGDTLFLQGCGRVDLPGGDSEVMYDTLTRRLAKIQDEVVLYPGHNYGGKPSAPMGNVRETNSYLQIKSLEDWLGIMGG